MSIKNRAQTGKFATKSQTPRKVRSVNLTDAAWQWLARTAATTGLSRNDWIEAMAGQQPIMEMVQPDAQPIMETVQVNLQPVMETVQADVEPFMETASEIERLRQTLSATDRLLVTKNAAIAKLESELSVTRQEKLEANLEIDRLESELASRESTQHEKSTPARADFSKIEAADLLNQLKARRKKSGANLADMEMVLEILDHSQKRN
ncbi:hypothetical protein [Microcoleus sp. PH2017_22_RUC_O_B]|nr:hypothetical protein [Microcoleus sp. PH2017_22_RUC_O_B]